MNLLWKKVLQPVCAGWHKLLCGIPAVILLLLSVGCAQKEAPITELYFLNWGYEDTRYTSLYSAVQKFNQSHPDRPYALSVEKYQDNDWNEYLELCGQRHREGKLDLFSTAPEFIGIFAEQDVILPLDDLLSKELFQQEYFPTVWSSMAYNGHYWGIAMDTDVQIVFVNRAALRAAGYSEKEIQELPDRTASGHFLMQELLEVARIGVHRADCRFGILHRPKKGQFFYMVAQAFGAFTSDKDGTVSFHEEQYAEMLSFYQSIVNEGLLPENVTSMSWPEINQAFSAGQTAVYFGACYSLYDSMIECNAITDDILNQYVPLLFPAVRDIGRPLTISHPIVYAVDSNTKYRNDIMEILTIAFSDSHNFATHCVSTYHLPVTVSALESPVFQNNGFLMDNMYMLDYAVFLPTAPDTWEQMEILFQDVIIAEQTNQLPEDIARSSSYWFSGR